MNYLVTQESLDEAVRLINASSWAAVDTEADSLHHYVEKLCLVQVSAEAGDWVIDPLVSLDLSGLLKTLEAKTLIFHGADFDVRTLKKAGSFEPSKIFDTMIAAQLLGYERFGLADLAERICGVKLSKSSQTADWSERPLKTHLLEYAVNDTRHLHRIRSVMAEELASLGRMPWLEEICARLLASLNEKRPEKSDRSLDWQIKGSKDLSMRALTYLRELWGWRETEAKRLDRPTFKVMNSDFLLQLAGWAEKNPRKDILEWREAPRHAHKGYRDALNAVLQAAVEMPPVVYTAPEKNKKSGRRLTGPEQDKLGKLKEARVAAAASLKIQPSTLVTNFVLENMIRSSPKDKASLAGVEGIYRWQAEVLADTFLPILAL